MTYSLSISVRAQKEIAEAFLWYAKESRTATERLLGFVDDKLSIIQRNPLQYPVVHKTIRRALIKKFPYSIFYLIDENRLKCLHFFIREESQYNGNKPLQMKF